MFCAYIICFTYHPIRTWCISYFKSAFVLLFLVFPFLIWITKTSSLSKGHFLKLNQKVSLLFLLRVGSFLVVVWN